MVAMGVLIVIVLAATTMLVHALSTTGDDRQRVRAANLAAQEIERVRGLLQTSPSSVIQSDATHTVVQDAKDQTLFRITSFPVVSGQNYSLLDTLQWQDVGSYNSMKLSVKATWNNMHGVAPVTNNAVISIAGTGGDGSSGSTAPVKLEATSTPSPVVTLAPTCNLSQGALALNVNTSFAADGLATVAALTSGTVYATPSTGNPCTTVIPLSLVNGVATGTLPYGNWDITAATNDTANDLGSEKGVTISAAVNTAGTINITDTRSCANTGAVTVGVSSKNLWTLVNTLLSSGTVTAVRTQTATCPSITATIPVAAGIGIGDLSYGTWTLTAPNGEAPVTVIVNAPVVTAPTITVDDSTTSCAGTGAVNLTVESTVSDLSSLPTLIGSGTVTATRAATNSCPAYTAPAIQFTNGAATASLSYGSWTFSTTNNSITYTSPAITINSGTTVPVTLDAVTLSCNTPSAVTVNVQAKNTWSGLTAGLSSGTVTAVRAALGSCPTLTVNNIAITNGSGIAALSYGTWAFAINGATSTLVVTAPTASTPTSGSNALVVSDSTCPYMGTLSLAGIKSLNTFDGISSDYTGTVTATPSGSNTCGATPLSISVSGGSATQSLSAGSWTLSATGATTSPQITVTTGGTVSPTLAFTDNSCPTSTSIASIGVTTSVTVPGGLTAPNSGYKANWLGTLGSVSATPATSGGICANVPLTYASGKFSGALPWGSWKITATLPDGATATENVTSASAGVTGANNLAVQDDCGGYQSVSFKSQQGLIGLLLGTTVTATRSTSSSCSTPVTTTFSTIAGGLLTGPIAYGNWTFSGANGTSAVATVPVSGAAVTLK